MALRDYWDAARAVVREGSLTAFGETLKRGERRLAKSRRVALTDTELEVLPWPEFVRDGGNSSRRPRDDRASRCVPGSAEGDKHKSDTRGRSSIRSADGIHGQCLSLFVGYKYEVRDNESAKSFARATCSRT